MNDEELKASEEIINKNAVEERMKNLSKARLDAEAKSTEEARLRQESDARATAAEKERDFFKGFSTQTSKYPGAAEYQDKILEKVNLGYDMEDATVSVLAKEGKLGTVQAPIQRQSPAGGSASNQIQTGGSKSIAEMSREEKRQAVLEAQTRGDLSNS